jgi:uncharacterized protein with FMN-binding domain
MPKPDAPKAVSTPAPVTTKVTTVAEKSVAAPVEAAAPVSVPEHAAPAPAPSSTPDFAPADFGSSTPKPDAKPASRLYPKEHYSDGTYLGWGTSRHGDIQASVTIKDGRIVATSIARSNGT